MLRRGALAGDLIRVCLALGLAALVASGTRGDEFERIEGEALAGALRSSEIKSHEQLSFEEIEALPAVLRESRSALLAVKTDRGNLARLLVAPALRRAPGSDREPVPVLVLERFGTFDAANLATRLARGKDLVVFDGFRVDLDSGQVVPEGQGGDIQFLATGDGGPRLTAIGEAELYTFMKSPVPGAESGPDSGARPTVGRGVAPGDFRGRYRLYANGQWSGTLDLEVDPNGSGAVSGRFRSDLDGSAYAVRGQVAADVPNRVTFRIRFPRSEQDFDGYLWTEGKGALAGTLTLLDRTYGFFAIRDGGRFAPEGEDVGPLASDSPETGSPGRRTVVVRHGEYTLDGRSQTDAELTEALRKARRAEPATWVLLQVPDDETFAAIERAFAVIGAAGVGKVRLGPADPRE